MSSANSDTGSADDGGAELYNRYRGERRENRTEDAWDHRQLLPGPTAKRWSATALVAIGTAIVGAAGALICVFALVARTETWDPITIGFVLLTVTGTVAGWVCNGLADRKGRVEVRAGYTTVAQGNNEVVRLYSPTGVVMREAGRPNLTRSEWEAAMLRVRAFRAAERDN